MSILSHSNYFKQYLCKRYFSTICSSLDNSCPKCKGIPELCPKKDSFGDDQIILTTSIFNSTNSNNSKNTNDSNKNSSDLYKSSFLDSFCDFSSFPD